MNQFFKRILPALLFAVGVFGSAAVSAELYVLVPDDKDWLFDDMMVSADGVDHYMAPAPGMCGWYMMAWEGEAPDEVLVYLKNKPEEKLGATGLWGNEAEPTPIPLKAILDALGSDKLYFIPDDSQWPEGLEDAQGFFVTDPGVMGTCEFSLAALIYDSDESVNGLFSTDGDNSDYSGCTGVRHGIVKAELGSDNKPQFNDTASTSNARICAGSANEFKTLFNYTAGLNEVQCYDMHFRRYGKDSRWGFDSDSTHYSLAGDELVSGGYTGGFYPLEKATASTRVTSISPQACNDCRTKRSVEAPVPYSYSGNFEQYCNTPGWFDGVNCDRLVSAANSFYDGSHPAVWDLDAREDWDGVTRNRQFCFESHATFTYSEDQEFSFRGNDDIWVFINRKLALDNGGAHFAAPGLVVLKNLNTIYGSDFLVPGNDYSLDIFYCNRRSTMANVTIKTNIVIKQTTGLSITSKKNSDGSVTYSFCYDRSGDGSCASVALGFGSGEGTVHACGDAIKQYGTLKYKITTRAGQEVATLESGKSGWQYGGIDISNPFKPIVNADKISGLAPGSYRLVIDFVDKTGTVDAKARTYINFRIKGNLDVMTQNSTYTVNTGDEKSPYYISGTKWSFMGEGLAGARIPVYVSAFADGGVDLLSAVGQKYTLVLDKGMTAYTSKTGDTKVTWPKVVGASGIDTIWVSVGSGSMTTNPEAKLVTLKSRAKIKFYAPRFDFATPASVDASGRVVAWKHPLSSDPDYTEDGDEYYHWIGSDVKLYVLVVNPVTGEICTSCQMSPVLADAPAGVTVAAVKSLGEGAYAITVRSSKEYMDNAAYVTISTSDDVNEIGLSSYTNMRFRRAPVPYPQLVELFDVFGTTMGPLNIPEPYYSPFKNYLDGRADSIAIYYSRPFKPNAQGSYADSLPRLICVDWDKKSFERHDFYRDGVSTQPRDTSLQCSYIIDSTTIYKSFMARYKANGNKSDSILTFVPNSTFSANIKTYGSGKILSFLTYEDRKKLVKHHFDRNITDRIAPVIVGARIDNFSDQLNRLTVTLSEPVKLLDQTNSKAPFSFYMNSATEVFEANRYANPVANAAPGGLGTNKLTMVFDKTQPIKNPTPRLGDYIRFRADSWMWSDTVGTNVADYWHWNSPTDYNATKRLPSPWVQIMGNYTAKVIPITNGSVNKNVDVKNTPVVEVFTIPETMKDGRVVQEMYPYTMGFEVMPGMATFMRKDSVTEKFFNEHPESLAEVYFQYELKIYDSQGSVVAGGTGRVYCLDEINKQKFGKEYFGGKDCRTSPGSFYVAWNMLTNQKRIVGDGTYTVKLSTYVNLAALGKPKSSIVEVTEKWRIVSGKGSSMQLVKTNNVVPGSSYVLFDMQGRVLERGITPSMKKQASPYIIKSGNRIEVVRPKK